jgi:hypothetical protein
MGHVRGLLQTADPLPEPGVTEHKKGFFRGGARLCMGIERFGDILVRDAPRLETLGLEHVVYRFDPHHIGSVPRACMPLFSEI